MLPSEFKNGNCKLAFIKTVNRITLWLVLITGFIALFFPLSFSITIPHFQFPFALWFTAPTFPFACQYEIRLSFHSPPFSRPTGDTEGWPLFIIHQRARHRMSPFSKTPLPPELNYQKKKKNRLPFLNSPVSCKNLKNNCH